MAAKVNSEILKQSTKYTASDSSVLNDSRLPGRMHHYPPTSSLSDIGRSKLPGRLSCKVKS
jgi:hypothetical protein